MSRGSTVAIGALLIVVIATFGYIAIALAQPLHQEGLMTQTQLNAVAGAPVAVLVLAIGVTFGEAVAAIYESEIRSADLVGVLLSIGFAGFVALDFGVWAADFGDMTMVIRVAAGAAAFIILLSAPGRMIVDEYTSFGPEVSDS